jgi:hypothetical protein
MKRFITILTLILGITFVLSSCSTTYNTIGNVDSLYPDGIEPKLVIPQYGDDNFSARNINPEYIARYTMEQTGDELPQSTSSSINVYNNFYGYNTTSYFNPRFHFGIGLPMWGWYNPWWGWHDPWFGWNSMWGWNMGMGWGNPWMMNPWMGGMWGWRTPVIIIPTNVERRQVVTGPRPGRGSGTSVSTSPSPNRYIRREAVSSTRNIVPTSTETSRNFTSSRNEYTTGTSRISTQNNSRTNASGRTSTAAPRTGTRYNTVSPTYSTRTYDTQRSGRNSNTINRNTTQYNRGTVNRSYNTPSRNTYSQPSRSGTTYTTPLRSTYSSPSRGGSVSTPSRGGRGNN